MSVVFIKAIYNSRFLRHIPTILYRSYICATLITGADIWYVFLLYIHTSVMASTSIWLIRLAYEWLKRRFFVALLCVFGFALWKIFSVYRYLFRGNTNKTFGQNVYITFSGIIFSIVVHQRLTSPWSRYSNCNNDIGVTRIESIKHVLDTVFHWYGITGTWFVHYAGYFLSIGMKTVDEEQSNIQWHKTYNNIITILLYLKYCLENVFIVSTC